MSPWHTNICSYSIGGCSSPSTAPTASSSSSRRGGGRCRPATPPDRSSRSRRRRRRSRARCSTTSSRVTRGSRGAAPRSGSPTRPVPPLLLEHASFVVFDLETTGSLAGPLADRRDRRPAGRGARGRRHVRDARQPGRAAADGDHRPHGHRPGRRARSTGRRPRRASLPLVRRRRRARRPQRALRHGVPRPRRRAADRAAGRGAGRRHGLARPAAAERADEAVRPRAPLALLRHVGRAVSPGARRCRGDRRDPDRPDRARAGARRRDGGRPRRAVGTARPPAPRQALARRGGTDDARARTCSATRTARRCTSGARATSARGSARTSPASGSGRRSRRRSVRSAQIDWQPCGSELEAALDELRLLRELGRRRTRAARGPTATSTCGAAARAGSAAPSRRRTGRSRAGRSPGGRRRRSTASRATIRGTSCPACGCGCGGSRATCASRTPPGCATGSRRSSRWSSGSTSSGACGRCAPASSCRRSSRGWCGRSSSRAASSRAVPCRVAAALSLEVDAGSARSIATCSDDARGDRGRRAAPARDLHAPAGARAAGRRARAQCDPRCGERGSLGCVSMRPDDEAPAVAAFSDRVAEAVERKRSQLVVGLDPRVDLLPVELRGEAVLGRAAAAGAVERFCKGIIDVVAPVRRRRQAAGRVLRGARQRRLDGARGGVAVRVRGRACS